MKKVLVLSVVLVTGLGSVAIAGGKPSSVPAGASSVPTQADSGMSASQTGRDTAVNAINGH